MKEDFLMWLKSREGHTINGRGQRVVTWDYMNRLIRAVQEMTHCTNRELIASQLGISTGTMGNWQNIGHAPEVYKYALLGLAYLRGALDDDGKPADRVADIKEQAKEAAKVNGAAVEAGLPKLTINDCDVIVSVFTRHVGATKLTYDRQGEIGIPTGVRMIEKAVRYKIALEAMGEKPKAAKDRRHDPLHSPANERRPRKGEVHANFSIGGAVRHTA